MNAVKKAVSDGWTDVNTKTTNGLNTMRTSVTTAMNGVKASVESVMNALVDEAYGWGRDICLEMARGIRNNAASVIAEAKKLASKIDDVIGFSVPETGPLSHADEYMPDFMDLLAGGITKNSRTVLDAVREIARLMREGLQLPDVDFKALNLPHVPAIAGAGVGGTTTTNNKTTTINGLRVIVNGYNVQNDDELAERVANKINDMLDEDGSVFK